MSCLRLDWEVMPEVDAGDGPQRSRSDRLSWQQTTKDFPVQKLLKSIVATELIALVAFNIAVRIADAAEPGRSGSGNISAFDRWSQISGACFYLLGALFIASSILIVARHGRASIGRALTFRSLDGVSVLLPIIGLVISYGVLFLWS
jgi:hypothetical protein